MPSRWRPSPIDHLSGGWRLRRPQSRRRRIFDPAGRRVERPRSDRWRVVLIDKGNLRHFMAKEIHEQPEVIGHTLAHYVDMPRGRVVLPEYGRSIWPRSADVDLRLRHGLLCGAGRQVLVRALCAPSRRNRHRLGVPLPRAAAGRQGGLALFISQSGETADTLAALALLQGARPARGRDRQRARPRPSRARATWCSRRWPGPKSASPRPRPSRASWRRWRASRSRAGRARGALSPMPRRTTWCAPFRDAAP